MNVAQRKVLLEQRLKESGEEARLEDYLRQKLIESGWKDELKKHCKDIIRRKGLEKVTVDELVDELVVKGRFFGLTKGKPRFRPKSRRIFWPESRITLTRKDIRIITSVNLSLSCGFPLTFLPRFHFLPPLLLLSTYSYAPLPPFSFAFLALFEFALPISVLLS